MRKLQQGFTLIELVVVITILGILAAFAIPRFAGLDASARVSAISGLAGSLRSASSLAHSLYLAAGTSPTTVLMEGTSVTLVNGYPDATAAGISAALQDYSSFTVVPVVATPNTITYTNNSLSTSTTCKVLYTASTGANIAPVITLTNSSC